LGKKALGIKELELGSKSKYWDDVKKTVDIKKLAESLGVAQTTPYGWLNELGNKPNINKLPLSEFHKDGLHRTTSTQKEHALKIFNMGKNALFWNGKLGHFDIMAMRSTVGVSEWTLRYWLALWNYNHSTNLDYVPSTGEDLERNKSMYFDELYNFTKIGTFEAMAKYNMSSSLFKKWSKEFKDSYKVLQNKKNEQPLEINKGKKIIVEHSPLKISKTVKVNTPTVPLINKSELISNPIEVVDNFFNNFSNYISKQKEVERQRDEYKIKCEKWAKQIIELQNALINKT